MTHGIFAPKNLSIEQKGTISEALFSLFPINFISEINRDGNFMSCNDRVLDFFNIRSFEEIIGQPAKNFTSKLVWENTEKVLESGLSLITEESHTKPNGEVFYFLSIKSPIRDKNNEPSGVICIAIDITDRKKTELELKKSKEELEEANKAKTEFLANMRHDLRTPFAGILSVAEFLEEQETDPIKKEYLKSIQISSQSLLNHLNEILEYVKTDTGHFPIVEKDFDINKIIEDVHHLFLPNVANKNIQFDFVVQNPLPFKLLGDSQRLQRILMNLVSNAIKFTHEGYIKVVFDWFKFSDEKILVTFTIEDSGIGIPKDQQEKIFERFNRLNPSYQGNYAGNGLGLNIVKTFLEDLGGQYTISSEVGKGTQFTLIVPFKLSFFAHIEGKQSQIPKKNKILLIEDYLLIAKVSKDILEDTKLLNCTVDIAETGQKALELIHKNKYDLVLMDIGLPDIQGYDVATQIRMHPDKSVSLLPIIALTAHSEDEITNKCIECGINDVILKPLTKAIAQSLEGYLPKQKEFNYVSPWPKNE